MMLDTLELKWWNCCWWKLGSSTGLWRNHSKDPCMGDCGVAKWFICMEGCPWVPSLSILPWKIRARSRVSIQRSHAVLKLSPVQHLASLAMLPAAVCRCAEVFRLLPGAYMWNPCGHWSCRLLRAHGCERAHARAWGECGSWAREKEWHSLFPSDYVSLGLGQIRCFFKITNALPKIL